MRHNVVSQVFLFLLLLSSGILIAAQIRTQSRARTLAYTPDEQATLLSEMVTANQNLRSEVQAIEKQLLAYQADQGSPALESLVAELNRVKMANGMIEVSGPGIELTIDGPLTALDIQDILNELRNTGAEAIAVNDQRIVANSVVEMNNAKQLSLDGQNINRPYRFQAIGSPDTIETAMFRSGGVLSLLRHTYLNLTIQSKQQLRLVLPIYRSPADFVFAQAVE